MFTVNRNACPLPLYPAFADILDRILQDHAAKLEAVESAIIINFRDPHYSAESGGFHPLEVMISNQGVIGYVTDFSYVGLPPYAELAKEVDFDFTYKLFGQMGRDYPLTDGAELFQLYQSNFVNYFNSGVFTVSVSGY
jgi:hypothetical protein